MKIPNAPIRFKLLEPLRAVQLKEHPGSSLRAPTETFVEIPAKVVVEQESPPGPSGLTTILWNGKAYSAYAEDLEENGRIISDGTT